eukprot:4411016-Amphidinium_carterae.1
MSFPFFTPSLFSFGWGPCGLHVVKTCSQQACTTLWKLHDTDRQAKMVRGFKCVSAAYTMISPRLEKNSLA